MDLLAFKLFLKRQGLKERTIKQLLIHTRKILVSAPELTEESFNKFISWKIDEVSHASINKYIQAIKKVCEFHGWDWGDKIKKLKEEPRTRLMLDDGEIKNFLEVETQEKYTIFWLLAVYTGGRKAEIKSLRPQDIDPIGKTATFPKSKTGTGRTVPIPSIILKRVVSYVNSVPGEFLFYNPEKPNVLINDASISKDFRRRLKEIGVTRDVKPYVFRHSFANRLLNEAEAPLFHVQDLMGHSNPNTTRHYYHGNIKILHNTVKKDPLVKNSLSPEEQFKMMVDDLKKSGYLDNSLFDFQLSNHSLHIAIKQKEDQANPECEKQEMRSHRTKEGKKTRSGTD